MTGQDIFNLAMDLISKRQANGTIDANKTAVYKAKTLGLLTLWQGEMAVVLYQPNPSMITDLTSTLEIEDATSGAYFLAANLLLVEDPDSASFFEQKFETLKLEKMIKQPTTETVITDIYDILGGGLSGDY